MSDPLGQHLCSSRALVARVVVCAAFAEWTTTTRNRIRQLQYLFGDDGPMNGVITRLLFGAANGWNFEFFIMWDSRVPLPHDG